MGEHFPVEPECRAPKSGAMLSELLTDDVWYDRIVEFYSPLLRGSSASACGLGMRLWE